MLYPVGEVSRPEALASILDCRVGNLLATYLGISLGVKHKSKAICIYYRRDLRDD